ncbi:MAG: 50S ribosomal protein L11 methyltransferase [Bacteroidetes bacterium MED-G21]|nr:MAG: 50S ribosomal protein L11 methyltransferase [Bacteroidetes bacterium MED-G21]
MMYIEVCFNINVLDSAEINSQMVCEILVAELGLLNFESFVKNDDSLHAYVQEDAYDEKAVKDLYILHNPNFEIKIEVNSIEQQNWNAEWEKSFEQIEVGGKCVVRAPFHDKNEVEYDIVITPKMSFGTGHHETTHQMISHILNLEMKSKSVLDMGCGTGVLAIIAAMKGADFITAIDIDEWAYLNTIENTLENKCGHVIVKHGGAELLGNDSFDFIFANINLNILLNDMSAYSNVMHSGSKIIFSGFYTSDIPLIDEKAESLGMYSIGKTEKNRWAALLYQMR